MKSGLRSRQIQTFTGALCWLAVWAATLARAQSGPSVPYERMFPQSRLVVEKTLKSMQNNLAGRLPVLEGFARSGAHPLERYQRGYYQTTVQVSATVSGGSLVRVSAKVTAWYSDDVASRSGYQLLTSNGRIEADLLDQLAEQLASIRQEQPSVATQPAESQPGGKSEPTATAKTTLAVPKADSLIDAPEVAKRGFSPSSTLAASASTHDPGQEGGDGADSALQAEARNLEEILKNQAHPNNLVAVRKSGTAVVGNPSLTAKPLFLASLHDEFEMLDFNRDWVHVRISGLSRGWIWRNSVEMPEGVPDTDTQSGPAPAAAADLFHVVRDENAQFPGDWEMLRGKNVKILSVQNVDEIAKQAGSKERL